MYNVLLVEDDIQIREVIGDFFARRDEIRLDLAADGEIGLSKIYFKIANTNRNKNNERYLYNKKIFKNNTSWKTISK